MFMQYKHRYTIHPNAHTHTTRHIHIHADMHTQAHVHATCIHAHAHGQLQAHACTHTHLSQAVQFRAVLDDGHEYLEFVGMSTHGGGDGESTRLQARNQVKQVRQRHLAPRVREVMEDLQDKVIA